MVVPSLKPGWTMVKFGAVVKNTNFMERAPEAHGIERSVGLEHIDPENLRIRRWNSISDGTSSNRPRCPAHNRIEGRIALADERQEFRQGHPGVL